MIQLIKKSDSSFKLFMPKKVEHKISQLCREIHNVEWSGILFYTPEGTFEDNNIVIKCEDLFLMDIGSAATTEFEVTADVASYMLDNDLLDCKQALIHSHNNMKAFFSGTDVNTLKVEGAETPYYVSLVVNNAGEYVAALTRRIIHKDTIKRVSSYTKFDGEDVVLKEDKLQDHNIDVEYYDLKIEFEDNTINSIKSRIEELRYSHRGLSDPIGFNKKPIVNSNPYPKVFREEPTLFPKYSAKTESVIIESKLDEALDKDPYADVKTKPSIINSLFLQIITGSVIIPNSSGIDRSKWINNMPKYYSSRFDNNFKRYEDWIEHFVEYLMYDIDDPELYTFGLKESDIAYVYARDLIKEFGKYTPNKYTEKIIEHLKMYD